MVEIIYTIFYKKLPKIKEDLLPNTEKCKLVTFLNPYYMVCLKPEDYSLYNEFDYIGSDGIGPIVLNKVCGKTKSLRLSFDMSSLAGPVLSKAAEEKYGVYFLGAKEDEIEKSINTIKKSFVGINVVGYHHGYIKGEEDKWCEEIISSGAKIAILGMGAPLQDKFALLLKQNGFVGTVYTCGGFLHQTTDNIYTYPKWIDALQLRALYRIFTQRGMIRRMVETYPKFIVTYVPFLLFKLKKKPNIYR